MDLYTVVPTRPEVRKGLPLKGSSHCRVASEGGTLVLVAVGCPPQTFFVVAILRPVGNFGTSLEDELEARGERLIDFFHSLRPHLLPQQRSTVDYSDGRALVSYGWCYFNTWFNGCTHKRAFFKDPEGGNCRPNLNPDLWGLKPRSTLPEAQKVAFQTLMTNLAHESGYWTHKHFPETVEAVPTLADSCRHTLHFSSFTLAFDAKQFTHRDKNNTGFTNIVNFSDPGTRYQLGLANFKLEGCSLCDNMTLDYGDSMVCSVFSQDHDHFVDREPLGEGGRRVAVLFYSHKLEEPLHGQESQIQYWRNVILHRNNVLERMEQEGFHSKADLQRVRKEFDHLLTSCKDPQKASTEEGCRQIMLEMRRVKALRDARNSKDKRPDVI